MFLHTTKTRNPELIDFAFYAHRAQKLLPDTYIVDVDGLQQNAADILAAAKKNGITLYFMLKQLGRNPALAGIMAGLGWAGAVAVDWREALHYAKHSIPLGNVGHLVQPPAAAMERILAARPDIVTVYSLEKAKKVGELASALGRTQDVMLRVTGENDPVYSGQTGGFSPAELGRAAHAIRDIPGIRLAGVCSFPCLLYDDEKGDIIPTPNAQTVLDAAGFLRALGEDITQINLPSASCAHSMELISALGGTHAEPGHSLTPRPGTASVVESCPR